MWIGLFMLLMLAPGARARNKLTLKVYPAVAFAPAHVIVSATIEADAQNRAVEIIAESDDYYRSSEIELDGDSAPRMSRFEFHSLPPGTYHVKGILYGSSGLELAEVDQQANVIRSSAGH